MGHVVSSHRRTGSHLDLRQQPPLVVAVITAGILIGINNTLTTQTAMMVSLPPGRASVAYEFGGAGGAIDNIEEARHHPATQG
jgi:hypothetical protein